MSQEIVTNASDLPPPQVDLSTGVEGRATLQFHGAWRLDYAVPAAVVMQQQLAASPGVRFLAIDSSRLATWDSTLVSYLVEMIHWTQARDIEVVLDDLPQGVQALLRLASSVPERKGVRHQVGGEQILKRLGQEFIDLMKSTGEIMGFIGESVLEARRMIAGKARFRRSDLWLIIQQAGADALPIVSLVSFLVGLILAYIGTQQLEQFGARIFVANLVGLAMMIQMGALITAIVLAGRTGAAYAAQLGTMQANEEIDALRTLGISPMEFLVLPRMIALILMTPLLAIYANLMGILGGAFVVVSVGGVTVAEYFTQTRDAIELNHVVQGLINATVYGAVVAVSGCLRGMQCGRSAMAVGQATTSAVVTAIVFIVIAAAVLTVVFNALGF